MRSIAVIILLASVAQELATDHVSDVRASMDTLVDRLVGKLLDKFFDLAFNASPLDSADLGNTTLVKLGHRTIPSSHVSARSAFQSPLFPTSRLASHPNVMAHTLLKQEVAQKLVKAKAVGEPMHGRSSSDRSAVVAQAFPEGTAGFPRDYGDVTIQCQRAVKAALKDGKKLMEVEFPAASLLSVPGDADGGSEMDMSAYHMKDIVRGFADDKSCVLFPDQADQVRQTTKGNREGAPFIDRKYRTGYLTTPSGLLDFGINVDSKISDRCKPDDSMYLVAYPSFNVNEMLMVQELYDDVTKANGKPIITFNGEIDRIRSGYYPSLFYPKLGRLSKELLPEMESIYYIRNFKGSRPGVLLRCYPGPWQVLRRENSFSLTPLQLVKEFDSMPTLQEVSQVLARR